ncbi:hypothetical protein SCHPADRAFT_486167 [Schizopora paradoxa]|uniref:Uncharacterized protein n=1 Tax=Schizopora paradoxa TaxID=27342 RepID=A0A0H2RGY7_9AGAM|nr:hypothetical protein SCHPADRAFT_486167 [Schizopora paradoxa]
MLPSEALGNKLTGNYGHRGPPATSTGSAAVAPRPSTTHAPSTTPSHAAYSARHASPALPLTVPARRLAVGLCPAPKQPG